MIWALLAILGVPLWLIAVFLFVLLRARAKVTKIPGSFACKVRLASGDAPAIKSSFARYNHIGVWVHDVLVLHGGSPFLLQTVPYGIMRLEGPPIPVAEGSVKHVKKLENPVSLRLRLDGGAVIEVVCARQDEQRVLGPVHAATASPMAPAIPSRSPVSPNR